MPNALLTRLETKATDLRSTMDSILTRCAEDDRDELTDAERANFEDAEAQVRSLDERIAELADLEVRAAASAALSAKVAAATKERGERSPVVRIGEEARTYGPANPERSYFADVLAAARTNDAEAHARLNAHRAEVRVDAERSGTVANLGEFAPPQYLVEDYAALVRSGRPVANAIGSRPHPMAPSWSIPVVSQGTDMGFQAAELDTATTQDFDAGNITVASRTLTGYNDVSKDILDFSKGIALDREIFADLAKVYASKVETMVLNSTVTSNKGILQVSGTNAVTYTSGSPTVALLTGKIAAAESAIHTARVDSPNVLVMHPRRWAWLKSQTDTSGRPLVNAVAPSNALGIARGGAEGVVGEFYGLPVITSHAVPTNVGTGTNQDTVVVAKLDDCRLYESGLDAVVDTSSLSNKRGIRFVLSGYVGFTAERAPSAIATINGTGLVNPF